MSRFDRAVVDPDMALFNQPLDRSAGHRGVTVGQELIQSFSGPGLFNGEALRTLSHAGVGRGARHGLGSGGALAGLVCQDRIKSKATPTHMALSAMLNAGKLAISPSRRTR